MLLPDFPQGMGGVGAALNVAKRNLTRREVAPHLGAFTRAERRISAQRGPIGAPCESVVEISRVTTCETSQLRRHYRTVISVVYASTGRGTIPRG